MLFCVSIVNTKWPVWRHAPLKHKCPLKTQDLKQINQTFWLKKLTIMKALTSKQYASKTGEIK